MVIIIIIGLIGITEHTKYQFPKEQTLCYSENRIADVAKIEATRLTRVWVRNSPPKDRRKLPKEHDDRLFCLFRTNRYSVYSAIGSRIDGILFRSFRNQKRSQKITITTNSVYSHSKIVPKQRALSIGLFGLSVGDIEKTHIGLASLTNHVVHNAF